MRHLFLLSCVCISLSGCAFLYQKQGIAQDEKQYIMIIPQVTNKKEVLDLLGYPEARSLLSDSVWYYYSSDLFRPFLFLHPWISEQNIIRVIFNEDGLVKEVKHFTIADSQSIVISSDHTSPLFRKRDSVLAIFAGLQRAGGGDNP